MKYNKLGDSVASEMDRLLSDESFRSVFAKPEIDVSKLVSQEPSYKAFVRVASKQEDNVALALQYIVDSLAKTSEALDNMGLTKSATVALSLLNGVIKEASMLSVAQSIEDEMKDRVDVMSPDEILTGMNDDSKLPVEPDQSEHLPIKGIETTPLPVIGPKADMLSDDDGELKRKFLMDAMKGAVEKAPGTEQEIKEWKSKHAPKSHDLIPTSTKRNPTDKSMADDSAPGTKQELTPWKSPHAPKSHEQLPTKAPMLDRGKYERSKEKLNPPFKPANASVTNKEVIALFNKVNKWVKKG